MNVSLKFSIAPENTSVIVGKMVLFECLASRTANVEYFWKHNTKAIKMTYPYTLVNGRTLRIMKTSFEDNGEYTCVAQDRSSMEKISSSAYLLVQGRLFDFSTVLDDRFHLNTAVNLHVLYQKRAS